MLPSEQLGWVLARLGKLPQATQVWQKLEQHRWLTLEPDHPHTVRLREWLAADRLDQPPPLV